jgi:hypothetical protein
MPGPKQVDRAALLYEASLGGRVTERPALQKKHALGAFIAHAPRQTKALATVANAGDDVIMEVDADLF